MFPIHLKKEKKINIIYIFIFIFLNFSTLIVKHSTYIYKIKIMFSYRYKLL